jgi:hypothetical protein
MAGISRSATIVIAYLMKRRQMTLRQAFLFVKERRSIISPNEGFMAQLSKLDEGLHGKISFSTHEFYVSVLVDMGFDKTKSAETLKLKDGIFNLALISLLNSSN